MNIEAVDSGTLGAGNSIPTRCRRRLRAGSFFGLAAIVALSVWSLVFSSANNGNTDQPVPKIIGGVPAAAGAYPWMVAVLQRSVAEDPEVPDPIFNAQFCGGTLIAPQWVLSAAHCFANDEGEPDVTPNQLLVMIDEIELEEGVTLYDIDQVIVHEDFNTLNNSFNNDIALLRLAQPVAFPTLPLNDQADNPQVAPGVTARITGWGSLMWDDVSGTPRDFPFDLREADLPIISNQECQAALSSVGLNETHLCAGILNQGGVDTCAADSGGPIFVSDGQGGFLQAGITSFGIGCGLPNRPGVYTRVSSFIDWIQDNIGGGIVVPHWGNGQGLVTDLIVYNTSQTTVADTEIVFRDGAGVEVPMGTLLAEASMQELPQGVVFEGGNLRLPPLGIHTISTTGLGALVSGSIRLVSTGRIGAAIRFRIPGIGISGVGSAEPTSSLLAPSRRVGALNTGVAIHNPGSQPITADLVLKNAAGEEVPNGRAVLDLPALGQVARFINQLFPNASTANFQGTICVTARTGRVAAVLLELGNRPGEFTTLPVSPTTP